MSGAAAGWLAFGRAVDHAALVDADWNQRAPLSMRARLATMGEIFGGLSLVVVAVGLAARCSDAVAALLFG